MDLKLLKDNIEDLDKSYQIQIAKLLYDNNVILNENKNGIFVNLSEIRGDLLEKINELLSYINKQESIIDSIEIIKQGYKDNYFNNNKDNNNKDNNKDNIIIDE